jgi:hypothetical protein
MRKPIVVLLIALAITGCNPAENAANVGNAAGAATVKSAPEPVASSKPPDIPAKPAEGLEAIQDKLTAAWSEIQSRQSIAMQHIYTSENAIEMEIRSFGEIERKLTEADVDVFKQSLFDLVGEEFPVNIAVRECCAGTAEITGKITEVNEKENRILIVSEHEKNGNTDNPEAFWVQLTEDGKVVVDGEEATAIFDPLLIGKDAQAWTTGLVLESYPGQVSAIKVVAE